MYVLRMPARYLSDTASEKEKEVYEYYKQWIIDLNNNAPRGYILPGDCDLETRRPLFEIVDTEKL